MLFELARGGLPKFFYFAITWSYLSLNAETGSFMEVYEVWWVYLGDDERDKLWSFDYFWVLLVSLVYLAVFGVDVFISILWFAAPPELRENEAESFIALKNPSAEALALTIEFVVKWVIALEIELLFVRAVDFCSLNFLEGEEWYLLLDL